MSSQALPAISLQDVPELRRKSERISDALRQQLVSHLEALRPIYTPERVFGKLAGGKIEVATADRALAELKEKYNPFSSKPYDLASGFDSSWLQLVGSVLDVYPWEYAHDVAGKTITMTAPMRWVINYKGSYSFGKVRAVLAGTEQSRPEFLRQYVVNALVLQSVLRVNPGLTTLFSDLRYELKTETPAELKGLPVVTVTSCINSFRPPDDIISAATAFSGVPAFVELVDLESVKSPRDTLKERIEQLIA
jgi:hypothetical protein